MNGDNAIRRYCIFIFIAHSNRYQILSRAAGLSNLRAIALSCGWYQAEQSTAKHDVFAVDVFSVDLPKFTNTNRFDRKS